MIGPLKSGLKKRLSKVGHVYVLIGPGTFSSGLDNAIELHASLLHATLVGQPTGGEPSSWFGSKKNSEAAALAPDVPAASKLADALAGRDPAMDAALSAR